MRSLIPYLKLYKKHWFGLSLGMLLGFVTLLASVGLLTVSGWFLSAAAVAGLTIARETFNYMLPGGAIRGMAMGRTAGRWGERVVSHNATFKLLTELRVHFFKKLAPLIPSKNVRLRDADLLNRLVADVSAMDHVYLRLISPMVLSILGTLCLSAVIYWLDNTIGLIFALVLLTLTFIWPVLFYKLGRSNGESLTLNRSHLRTALLDWVEGHRELLLFNAEQSYSEKIYTYQDKLIQNQKYNAHITGLANGLLVIANGLLLTALVWLAADGVNGQAPDPFVALIAFAAMASLELLLPVASAFQHLGQTLTSARRLNEITEATPDVVFNSDETLALIDHSVSFNNVSFSYDEHTGTTLDNIDFKLNTAQKVAILGSTGSGKSTLLQLITRAWDVSSGEIQVGGQPLSSLPESQLRKLVSVVSQRVDILNDTLKENLLIANSNASEQQLEQVLNSVGLTHLLEDNSIDQWLGDGGRQLSGGEKRRIGIARAILHNAPIILLDEPTEGLDKVTESQIMSLLEDHFEGKTVLFVTHRLIGLQNMDAILLMEQGEIVETGDHHSLYQPNTRYYQLHQHI
jgi:ATP-binding cassette subfamily C protein CydC